MDLKRFAPLAARLAATCIGVAAASYTTYVAVTWLRYGKAKRARGANGDALLDMFIPNYEIGGRHRIRVAAPAEVTLSVAADLDLASSAVVRGIFKGREWILRSKPDTTIRPRGLLAQTKVLGWGCWRNYRGAKS